MRRDYDRHYSTSGVKVVDEDESVISINTSSYESSPLIGKWTAIKWSGNATNGGDPDPYNDEKIVFVAKDVVRFPTGTSFTNWNLTDNDQGVIITPDQETVNLRYDKKNNQLVIEFGYDKPATIIYERC